MVLLARSEDSATIEELRRILGDLGTVVWVVRDGAGSSEDSVVDRDGIVDREYGLGAEGLALIRPDGYLGLVAADTADPAVVRGYLAEVLRVGQPSTV